MKLRMNELPSGSNRIQIPVGKTTNGRVITSGFWSCESHKELSFASASVFPTSIAPLVDSHTGEPVPSIHCMVKESS